MIIPIIIKPTYVYCYHTNGILRKSQKQNILIQILYLNQSAVLCVDGYFCTPASDMLDTDGCQSGTMM